MKKQVLEEKARQLRVSEKAAGRLIEAAIQETVEQMPLLEAGIQKGDYAEVQSVAHRVKGYLLNLKFDQLGEVAQDINHMALAKADMGGIQAKFSQFKADFERLRKDLTDE